MRLPLLQRHLLSSREQPRDAAPVSTSSTNSHASVTRPIFARETISPCQPGDNSARCTTPASEASSQNLAIILGVVIPLSCAVIVLVYLHRRHLKKQKLEDINDPHKSLDFGLDGMNVAAPKNARGRKGPEMRINEIGAASSRKHHGLSMDLGMHMDSPYILPAGLNGSRESLHSMSRSLRDDHDPYRPVTQFTRRSTDNESLRFGRLNDEKGSLYSMSTGQHSALQDKAGLIANARPMSQSIGRMAEITSPVESTSSGDIARPFHSPINADASVTPARKPLPISKDGEEKSLPLPPPPPIPEPADEAMPPPRKSSKPTNAPQSPQQGLAPIAQPVPVRPESSNYGDDVGAVPFRMTVNEPETYDIDISAIHTRYSVDEPPPEPTPTLQAPPQQTGNRLSVMGMRPLPPDLPEDNPEVRANRIRSFYKEYFDDSKPNPQQVQYDEDIYSAYMDGVIYDPETGGFFAPNKPFAQGPGRRAMTPPPRARPRVSDHSSMGQHGRKFSMYSTMSGGGPRGRSLPKKKLPPPKALTDLPTPYLMRDDSAIFNAADFAPPTTFRNMQNGSRPGSPMGLQRPYSPSVKAFTPLASSFDNLAALPSPHDLRKSGTFTALDFAPPSKIRDPMLSPSDAGSIRSNRSGMSAVQKHAVREGAYRVSRIPKELVTTTDDMALQLKPRMNLTTAA